jgi:enamine deaminase RidA (YjgF/YER057c/UK114 family)
MTVLCSAVRVALDSVGTQAITGPLASHVASCAACGAEMSHHISMNVMLRRLSNDEYRAPTRLERAVMSSLGPVAVPDLEHRQYKVIPIAAAVATAAVATAAASTAVILHLRRTRAA